MPAKCKVVGLWPCFYATIRLLCHCLREHIFVVQEATTSIFFAVVLWWANNFIVIRERSDDEKYILHIILQEAAATSIFLRHIPNGNDVIACASMSIIAKTRRHNMFWCFGKQLYCRGATTVIRPSRDGRTQQSNFSFCPSKDDSNKRYWLWDNGNECALVRRIARSDDDKDWLQRGMLRDRATQQPTKQIHCIASTRATSHHPIARRTMMSIFYCRIAMSKQQWIQFFRSIAREQAN